MHKACACMCFPSFLCWELGAACTGIQASRSWEFFPLFAAILGMVQRGFCWCKTWVSGLRAVCALPFHFPPSPSASSSSEATPGICWDEARFLTLRALLFYPLWALFSGLLSFSFFPNWPHSSWGGFSIDELLGTVILSAVHREHDEHGARSDSPSVSDRLLCSSPICCCG